MTADPGENWNRNTGVTPHLLQHLLNVDIPDGDIAAGSMLVWDPTFTPEDSEVPIGGWVLHAGPTPTVFRNLRLDATHESPVTFPAGVQVHLPWTAITGEGAGVDVDEDDNTQINFTVLGTYLLRMRWGMSTVVNGAKEVNLLANVSEGIRGDTIQSSVSTQSNGDPVTTWLWRCDAGSSVIFGGKVDGGSGPETAYDIYLDIARVN